MTKMLFIGVDGLSPDGIRNARTPVMDSLMANGTSCMNVQAVLPTSSSPNWASMMMGVGPDKHKVTSNNWLRGAPHGKLDCYGQTRKGRRVASWPTFFGGLRQQRPTAKIACFNDWKDYNRLIEPNVLDYQWEPTRKDGKQEIGHFLTTQKAVEYYSKEQPDLLFVHLDHVDHAGHSKGHGSQDYYRSVEVADSLIGILVHEVNKSPAATNTVIIISADHGGKGFGHGGDSPEERTVPWIACGPGISKGKSLNGPYHTFDTAPTVLRILNVKPPECWVGKPIIDQ